MGPAHGEKCSSERDNTAVQSQTAVTAHLNSEQLLLFVFVWQCSGVDDNT